MGNKDNKIVVALDNDIYEGELLVEEIEENSELEDMVYGYKVSSLWILENGLAAVESLGELLTGDHKIILDMQKWSTDIPEIVTKQVIKISETDYVDELIACPMGGGRKSLEAFVISCKDMDIRPLCVLEMTHPESDSYLKPRAWADILHDAASFGIAGFIIPATKDPKLVMKHYLDEHFKDLDIDFYATGFKAQGGQTEPMRRFGVSKYIMGRAIYEANDAIQVIRDSYKEINPEWI